MMTETTDSSPRQRSVWREELMHGINKDKFVQLAVLFLAELIGTGVLVTGCSSLVGRSSLNNGLAEVNIMNVSFAFSLSVLMALMMFGHISGGHINPAVSIGAVILGNMSVPLFFMYTVAQCVGATLGVGIIAALSPNLTEEFCAPQIAPELGVVKGLITEIFITFILVFLVCAFWDPRNSNKHDSAPIKIGLAIGGLIICFARYTGASMNPARTIGPAIIFGFWKNHWVYWVGPMIGGTLAGLLYRNVFDLRVVESQPKLTRAKADEP